MIASGEAPCIDIEDTLKSLEPKFERKEELNAKMVEIEKRKKDRTLLQEKPLSKVRLRKRLPSLIRHCLWSL